MKLPNHYPHLHRDQHKKNTETAIDDLICRLAEINVDRPDNERRTIDEFTEKLRIFRHRLPGLHGGFILITDGVPNQFKLIRININNEKNKHKQIGIISRGIILFSV